MNQDLVSILEDIPPETLRKIALALINIASKKDEGGRNVGKRIRRSSVLTLATTDMLFMPPLGVSRSAARCLENDWRVVILVTAGLVERGVAQAAKRSGGIHLLKTSPTSLSSCTIYLYSRIREAIDIASATGATIALSSAGDRYGRWMIGVLLVADGVPPSDALAWVADSNASTWLYSVALHAGSYNSSLNDALVRFGL